MFKNVKIASPKQRGTESTKSLAILYFLLNEESIMKTVSHLLLLVIALVSLTACDSGKGPSKPASTQTQAIIK